MRLKYTFEMTDLDDQTIAVPVGETAEEVHGVIKLNDTAAFIFNHLRVDTTMDAIIDEMLLEYDAPREIVVNDVTKYIAEFTERGLLTI